MKLFRDREEEKKNRKKGNVSNVYVVWFVVVVMGRTVPETE